MDRQCYSTRAANWMHAMRSVRAGAAMMSAVPSARAIATLLFDERCGLDAGEMRILY